MPAAFARADTACQRLKQFAHLLEPQLLDRRASITMKTLVVSGTTLSICSRVLNTSTEPRPLHRSSMRWKTSAGREPHKIGIDGKSADGFIE